MVMWVGGGGGDSDPRLINLVGRIAMLGAEIEDRVYRICDALQLGDLRFENVTQAIDRIKDRAKQEGGIPPWATVDGDALLACCAQLKTALAKRNHVIHSAYVNRRSAGAWEAQTGTTNGKRPTEALDLGQYERALQMLRAASGDAADMWLTMLPPLSSRVYDLRFGSDAPDVVLVQVDHKWVERPTGEEVAVLPAAFEVTYPASRA